MRVLTEVHGALVKQYEALFGFSGVEIRFTTKALREICQTAASRGMGARGLRGILVRAENSLFTYWMLNYRIFWS
jgi:ATP-dependent Clp protease ATP-binding subunit ClpX